MSGDFAPEDLHHEVKRSQLILDFGRHPEERAEPSAKMIWE
jgi:hypothetical protein